MAFHSAGLFGRYQDRAVEETVLSLRSFLESRGLRVFLGDTTASEEDGFTVGFNYWIHPNVVLKADYDEISFEDSDSNEDRLNLGIGWQF